MQPILWSILCTILMIIVIAVEMITPTFGVLIAIAVILGIGSSVLAFYDSNTSGYLTTAVNLMLFPASFWIFYKWMGSSRLRSNSEIHRYMGSEPEPESAPHALVGQRGTAMTPLRPGGHAEIGGKRMDVMTEGKFVDAGKNLKVIKVSSGTVLVEEIPN